MKKSLANSVAFLSKQCIRLEASGAIARRAGVVSVSRTINTPRVAFTTIASPRPGVVVSSNWVSGIRTLSSVTTNSSSSSSNTTVTTIPGVSDRGGAIIQWASSSSSSSSLIHLPQADDPVGLRLYKKAIYCPISRILRTSAHVGSTDDNQKANGIVGDDVTPEEARNHARNSGLRLLATIHDFLDGDLGRVEQVLHLRGMVKASTNSNFAGHASVIDGCSEVLAEAFGPEIGIGTRECFGVGSLGATVACTLEVRVCPLE